MASTSSSIKRLSTEFRHMMKVENRVSDYYAAPLEDNMFEWHFTIKGEQCTDSPFRDGIYHGALLFSRTYPFEPPDIIFFTPNGRFELHTKICSTISSFHKERWQPTYDIPFILMALRLFMAQEDEVGSGAIQKGNVTVAEKKRLAEASWRFQCKGCNSCVNDLWEKEMSMYSEASPSNSTPAVEEAMHAGTREQIAEVVDVTAEPEPATAMLSEDDPEALAKWSSAALTAGSMEQKEMYTETCTTKPTGHTNAAELVSTPTTDEQLPIPVDLASVGSQAECEMVEVDARTHRPAFRLHIGELSIRIPVSVLDNILVICVAASNGIMLRKLVATVSPSIGWGFF